MAGLQDNGVNADRDEESAQEIWTAHLDENSCGTVPTSFRASMRMALTL